MGKLPKIRASVLATLLALFLVVVMPIYLLGFGIYQWGYRMTTDEITQSLYTRATFFTTTLDTELERIREVHQECLNDSELYYYINALPIMDNYEAQSRLLAVEKRLGLVHDSSAYIEEVTLWTPGLPHMISASRGVDPANDGWKEVLDAPMLSDMAGLSLHEGSLYLCAAYPTGIRYEGYVPQYILAIRLSNERIMEDLMSFNLYPDSGTLLQSEDGAFRLEVGRQIGAIGELSAGGAAVQTFKTEEREAFLLVSVESEYLNLQMHTFVLQQSIYGGLATYRRLFVVFTIVALCLVLAFVWFSRRLVSKPIGRLVDSLKQVESGKLDVRIEYKANDEFGYLYVAFNQMVESLGNMLEINARQMMLTQEAELRQLQAQIDPHFLHNSFFILYRMAKDEDYENLSEFLTHLSEYFRYVTRNANMEVNLADEDSHARYYVQIQLFRFGKRISAQLEPLPESLAGRKVPRLILQPLLENAFVHGFKDTISGGLLRLWYQQQDGKIFIHVQDNGGGLPQKDMQALQSKLRAAANASRERSGVVNVHQRLRIFFGPEYGLRVENQPGGGTRFTLVLPEQGTDERGAPHV